MRPTPTRAWGPDPHSRSPVPPAVVHAALDDQALLGLMLRRAVHGGDGESGNITDRLAAALLERFAGLGAIVAAEPGELARAPGLDPVALSDLKLLRELAIRLARDETCRRPVIASWTALVAYVRTALAHEPREQFRTLFLDRRNNLLRDELVAHGTVDHAPVYVREVMGRVSADLGEPDLNWVATCHYDTDQPHAHVLVRGRRGDGRDLVIPRDYIGYGFRARAQEAAQERLGDLSRVEAERRIWKETGANRFTGFDRRLLAAADANGTVEDGVGVNDAWAALTRGRLRHLEGLGLAVRAGRRYKLDGEMETKLRTLQARRDIIRTLNQRRLEGAREVRPLGTDRVRGVVVKSGFHDEAGAAPFVVVKDAGGVEHYARVRAGDAARMGSRIALEPMANGLAQVVAGRGADLGR